MICGVELQSRKKQKEINKETRKSSTSEGEDLPERYTCGDTLTVETLTVETIPVETHSDRTVISSLQLAHDSSESAGENKHSVTTLIVPIAYLAQRFLSASQVH